ncbi:hypothetical protein FBX98_102256 [Burkholderia sp. SJZ115]|jgi:hypothetical protein|nr:hypothetical protein FB600_102256 [Burkholderia sp. SJZ089]TWD07476.1 hypothetical protein FBX98_102256 [Burkholderia sp. SJZ115]TWD11016.1 hypothetical protein FB601_102255 [Burkholderia sp. SJZ091]
MLPIRVRAERLGDDNGGSFRSPFAMLLSGIRILSTAPRGRAEGARRLALSIAAGLVLGIAAGCTPALDWRTLHSDAGYSIDLPAKPTLDARPVEIGGASMDMRMQAAHVEGAVFAVGTVSLPDARPATQRAVLDALRAGLSRNLRAQAAEREVAVPLAAGGSTPGIELRLSGEPAGASGHAGASGAAAGKTVVARLVARGAHVYQAVAIADAPLPAEALDQFLGSFKLD